MNLSSVGRVFHILIPKEKDFSWLTAISGKSTKTIRASGDGNAPLQTGAKLAVQAKATRTARIA